MKKLLCWLIRRAGGKHKERRLRKGERPDLGGVYRICARCGNLRAVKSRAKKEAA